MVQGGFVRAAVGCLCAAALILAPSTAAGSTYFGGLISGETYGRTGHAPLNSEAWDLFERRCLAEGQKVGNIKPVALDRRPGWPAVFAPLEAGAATARR